MNEELKVIISAEISELKKGVNEAKGAIGTFKTEVDKNKKVISEAWNNIGKTATKMAKVIIASIAGTVAALVTLSASTQEYRNEQTKLVTAFEASGSSADVAKETYNDLYRVLGDSGKAVEAANHLAKLTIKEQDLAEWTNICKGVYATFGDSLPIEGLTEAANETAKTGELTGQLADALNWAGVSEDEFKASLEACNSEAEREALIRETLNELYSDAAEKYEENNAAILAQNEAQAKLTEASAQLGAVIQPVVTLFTEFASEALSVITPYIQQLVAQYMPQLKEVLKGIGESLAPIAEFIAANLPTIMTIAGIILAIAAAYKVGTAALAAYSAIKTVYTAVTIVATAAQTAFAAANLAALAPILLVIAAIAAVIAIIVICVKHWEQIKSACANAWNSIKEKTSEVVGKVVEKFNEMKDKASEKISAMKEKVSEKFNAMKEVMGKVMQAAKDTVSEKLNNMKQAYEANGGGMKGAVAAAMEGIKGFYTAGYTFIDNLTGGKLSSIVDTISSKMNAAKSAVSGVLESIKAKFDSILSSAANIVKSGIDKIKSFFNFSWSLPKLKLPHFSVSGKFSLNPPSAPKFSISWYKFGGVFDKTTLFPFGGSVGGLGEDGAEAIVPLEKNTKWLDRLASMLNEKQGGGVPIILQVDGKTLAEVTVDSINNLTRQTGSLPLKLA